jgi:hypothetical protein
MELQWIPPEKNDRYKKKFYCLINVNDVKSRIGLINDFSIGD